MEEARLRMSLVTKESDIMRAGVGGAGKGELGRVRPRNSEESQRGRRG